MAAPVKANVRAKLNLSYIIAFEAKWSSIMKLRTIAFNLTLALLISSPSLAQEVTVTGSSPPEAKLAALEAGSNKVSTATVRRYAAYLDRLEPRCQQPRTQIAEIAMGAGDTLQNQYRKSMSYLQILQEAVTMMDESGLRNQDCIQTFSLLVISLGSS